ncbi:coiled-coil domain-containing protein 43 isoform X1 [Anopheles ziemanni]|uniref:coiled-coil domain-containing protein 43 isoform X1 n=1 Tax=Anopheles ziemanni TaxID=345580 RepID=UPI00265FE996|nr:coiled-coil domain-containing protein 43 isoform X1 [Anopheles ziemanni]
MAASAEFNSWLSSKLKASNADDGVFGSYITGILEGDENNEEKMEALEGILGAIIESDLEPFIKEILDKWKICHNREAELESKPKLDVEAQLAKLLETQKLTTKVEREYTDEERRIKEQILSQYSQVGYFNPMYFVLSESEHDDDDEEGGAATSSDPRLVKNTNFADVQALAREKREQAKLESQMKKEKDKQDREKQRQLREEKKEKRKTVKGERRR